MNKQTIVIILLSVILLGVVGVYAYQQIEKKAYNQGVQDAVLLVNSQIINSLTQQGYVPFVFPYQNETWQINLVQYGNATKISK